MENPTVLPIKKSVRIKNSIIRNRTRIMLGALVVTTAGTAFMFRNQHVLNEWLEEKGLMDEYYHTEDDTIEG